MQSALVRLPSIVTSALAVASFFLVTIRAALTVDTYWDTLAYHWPFAARLAGLCDAQCFLMPLSYEQRYEGFPKLWHGLQGLVWRLAGSPAYADLLNIAMVVVLCVYLRRRFAVPLAWAWLAFLAIPEVQIELTASYVDLPLNVGITLALVIALRMMAAPSEDHRPDVVLALLALGLVAGSKLQLAPIALLAWAAVVVLAAIDPNHIRFKRRSTTILCLSFAGAAIILPKLIANAYMFGNPFYPVAADLGPIHFLGPEAMLQSTSISEAWLAWPSPVRWIASVLEFDAFRGRSLPWTIDQGDLPQSNPSFRMGGYFAAYVLGIFAILAWGTRTTPKRMPIIVLVMCVSVLCACLPLAHELRYYSFWMLTLVSTMLVLVHSPLFERAEQGVQRMMAHALILVAATSVVLMTGGSYLNPAGVTLSELTRETNALVENVSEGGVLCILHRHPRAFLYSDLFHPPRHYQTRALWSDEPADCTTRLELR